MYVLMGSMWVGDGCMCRRVYVCMCVCIGRWWLLLPCGTACTYRRYTTGTYKGGVWAAYGPHIGRVCGCYIGGVS